MKNNQSKKQKSLQNNPSEYISPSPLESVGERSFECISPSPLERVGERSSECISPSPLERVGERSSEENSPLSFGEGRGEVSLLIFSAPSGSGKSTIINWLMKEHPELNLYFSISCTSRAPRGTEQNGVEYFFLTPEEFRQRIANNEFLEYEEVYEDRFYGTLKAQVERQIAAGQNVVFDVDVKGGCNIKEYYGDRALSIFIQPPSVEELRRRLVNRGTDTMEVIEDRLAKAEYELTFADRFDHVVVNDDLAVAEEETYRIVRDFFNDEKEEYINPDGED